MVSTGDADVKEGMELVEKLNKGIADLKTAAAGWAEAFRSAMAEWVNGVDSVSLPANSISRSCCSYVARKAEKGYDASEPAEDF